MTPLRQRMLKDMQVRNLSPNTQRAYIENVARFARHFGRSPADLSPDDIRTYQVYLVRERKLAPSSSRDRRLRAPVFSIAPRTRGPASDRNVNRGRTRGDEVAELKISEDVGSAQTDALRSEFH